jgi:DegV family protein with EDD domain
MTHLVADTLSCLSVEEAAKLGISYLPQIIIFGDESYRDDTEMDSDTFIKRLKESSTLPKTSAPYPSLYNPFLDKLTQTGETILLISPSKKMSGTIRSAEVAVADYPDADIRIVDTNTLGSAMGSIVRKAVEWQQAGLSADEIEKNILDISKRSRTFFLVDTLEYLHKGGRIGAAETVLGSMLQMKPILGINDGQIEAVVTERTRKKAMAKFLELILAECPQGDESCVVIEQGGVPDQAQELAEGLKKNLKVKDIPITFLPPAILVHGGPGVLGVSFFSKE